MKENQKISVKRYVLPLRIVYETENFIELDLSFYKEEKKLYDYYKSKSGNEDFSLLDLPEDDPLIQRLEEKRTLFLQYWEKHRIPIVGSLKSEERIIRDFKKLRSGKWSDIRRIDDYGNHNILWDFSSLDSGLNQYFPEMNDVETTNGSIIDGLKDRERFIKAYQSKIFEDGLYRFKQNEKVNFLAIFKEMLRLGSGSQPVSNFPSRVAQYLIIESYYESITRLNCFENDHFIILDPCTGWGGRLLGTLCAYHKIRNDYRKRCGRELHVVYLTTDPNTSVHERFDNIIHDWATEIEPLDYFSLYKNIIGCETESFLSYCREVLSKINVSGVNVALTSPPYFDREKYSLDEAQSNKRYPKYQLWVEKFLSGMINNVNNLLVPNGRFYLNIANTKENGGVNQLQDDSIRFLRDSGMEEVITYKMALSGSCKSDNMIEVDGLRKKFEPVFVYQK